MGVNYRHGMCQNTTTPLEVGLENEVMGVVDDDGRTQRYVIADISHDDSWIAASLTTAVTPSNWR